MRPDKLDFFTMAFPDRLVVFRKEKGLTQQALAESIGLSVMQLRRYEAGTSQPTLDVLRKIAVALGVSADELVFETDERGPDDELRYQFEAIARFDTEDKRIAQAVLDGLILKHQAKRLASRSAG